MDSTLSELDKQAKKIVQKEVMLLLKEADYADVDWLPEDFAEQIIQLAWKHQFDIDKGLFRIELNSYLKSISQGN